ncbi:MAG: type IV pilin [Halolamina sp.]
MQLRKLYAEEGAVSPVVGIILMVAITAMLAAVIGTFVVGFDSNLQDAPQVTIDFEFDDGSGGTDDALDVEHGGGSVVQATRVTVAASEAVQYRSGGSYTTASDGRVPWPEFDGTTTEITPGDAVTVYAASGDNLNDATVKVVWDNGETGSESNTAVLGEWSR